MSLKLVILETNVIKKIQQQKTVIADILTMFCSFSVIVKLYLVLFCSFSVVNKLYWMQLVPFPHTQFLCIYVTHKKNKFKIIMLQQYNDTIVSTMISILGQNLKPRIASNNFN